MTYKPTLIGICRHLTEVHKYVLKKETTLLSYFLSEMLERQKINVSGKRKAELKKMRKPCPSRAIPSLSRLGFWKTKCFDSWVWHSLCWWVHIQHHPWLKHCTANVVNIRVHYTWRSKMNCGNLWMGFIIRPYRVIRSLLVSWRCCRQGHGLYCSDKSIFFWGSSFRWYIYIQE